MVAKLRPGKYGEYARLHRDVWPGVAETIRACNIRNYSIYHKDGWLYSYFEYVGSNFVADMAKMAADPITQEWWAVCTPCLEPVGDAADGQWWAEMEEVFHQE